MIETKKPLLFISDLQQPFTHQKALEFCAYVKRHYGIPDDNVYCVGDETDQYWASQWDKDPDARHTANQEITETIENMKPWYAVFPKLKIATSNHGTRWQRKVFAAEIPSVLMRKYEAVLGCPDSWIWKKRWIIPTKNPIMMEHGDRFGGATPHIKAAEANAMSTVIGHHHSKAGVEHLQTRGAMDGCEDEAGFKVWGMVTGCLIDFESYAFHYAREAKHKPQLGVGLVFNEGRLPIWLPLE